MIFLFDLDGTICDLTHRLHFIGATETTYIPFKDTKDWDAFHQACIDDPPIWPVITVARALAAAGHIIVYSSGRGENARVLTLQWLRKYRLPMGPLYMRKQGDHREDFEVKKDLLEQIKKDIHITPENLGGAFEDRQQVVDMYRSLGIKVFQVAKGNF